MKIRHFLGPLLYLSLLLGGVLLFLRSHQDRAFHSELNKEEILIGVAWPLQDTESHFLEGVRMAVEEINEQGGVPVYARKVTTTERDLCLWIALCLRKNTEFEKEPTLRKIKLAVHDDENSPETGSDIANSFAADPNIVAVIGHPASPVALPASLTYEKRKILFISTGATDYHITGHKSEYIFRNISNDRTMAKDLVAEAKRKQLKRIYIVYEQSIYGENSATYFHQFSQENGGKLEIVGMKSYHTNKKTHKIVNKVAHLGPVISDLLKTKNVDAIFLSGSFPSVEEVIRMFRKFGVETPILGDNSLFSEKLIRLGDLAEGTIVPTMFDPNLNLPKTVGFVQAFQKRFPDKFPDQDAALGYDAIQLLVKGFQTTHSTVPIRIATFLKTLREWNGVTGNYRFNENGEAIGKKTWFVILQNGKFQSYPD